MQVLPQTAVEIGGERPVSILCNFRPLYIYNPNNIDSRHLTRFPALRRPSLFSRPSRFNKTIARPSWRHKTRERFQTVYIYINICRETESTSKFATKLQITTCPRPKYPWPPSAAKSVYFSWWAPLKNKNNNFSSNVLKVKMQPEQLSRNWTRRSQMVVPQAWNLWLLPEAKPKTVQLHVLSSQMPTTCNAIDTEENAQWLQLSILQKISNVFKC